MNFDTDNSNRPVKFPLFFEVCKIYSDKENLCENNLTYIYHDHTRVLS